MKLALTVTTLLLALSPPLVAQGAANSSTALRPPAVPLVTNDPYFSVWSFNDHLADGPTRHWTGTEQPLVSMVRVDGRAYRIMGAEPAEEPVLPQTGLRVLPTRTIYDFEGAGIRFTLTFMSPLLASDLDILSRPVTYLTWEVAASDGKPHPVTLYFDASPALAVNTPDQAVTWLHERVGPLDVMQTGSQAQPVLAKSGDNLRIDWGYFYAGAPAGDATGTAIATAQSARGAFVKGAALPHVDDKNMPRAVKDDAPVLAFSFALGKVGAKPVQTHVILAYDDIYSIQYFHRKLRPYWRRKNAGPSDLLRDAEGNYASLLKRSEDFDRELMTDATSLGGAKYAQLAALAYRQSLAAHKLVANEIGDPFFFPKENFSNGCIATVDVIYPASPILLLLNPALLKASLVPLFDYAESERWHFPFAPHDLGTYPLANGQVYGGKEQSEKDQMPVEESGNMLLMVAALAKAEGKADFAVKHWDVLTKWAEYLKKAGLDPANQLCTDDFAGHLAHNTNLSLKAIEALGAYASLCEMAGKKADATAYRKMAQDFAARWPKMATDGDHFRLAFDKPGTWSQKYNLVWDSILGFKLFPGEVAQKEIAYYKTRLDKFGLPLDNRKPYTKLDWEIWTATLATSPSDFDSFVEPIYDWMNQSPTRVPLTDWYWTGDGKQAGFQARSVVGGVYIKMLADTAAWEKWRARAEPPKSHR